MSLIKFLPHVQRVWQELDYRIDIFRVTKGGLYRAPVR